MSAATVVATSLVLLATMLGSAPAGAAPSVFSGAVAETAVASTASTAPRAMRSKAGKPKPAPGHYTPPTGPLFNNPLAGVAARRRVLTHLIRTIDSVPGRQRIRIASWNIRSVGITEALVRAHNRGVSVRVIMDRLNDNADHDNPDVDRLARAFKRKEGNRRPSMKSGITRCVSSCRSTSGIAHTKFYLFSKAGKAKNVVMYGSYNATDLAGHSQWNDLFTMRGKTDMYKEFYRVFQEMQKDRPVRQPYLSWTHGKFRSQFFPYVGRGAVGDPLLTDLNKVNCDGATNGTGTGGHTRVRIAQTSMHGARGKAIATRLATMYARGCDVKIVYAVFGNEVLRILRSTPRGPVPMKQIVKDFDIDGVYDMYLHMKNMTVSGVYDGRRDAQVTWNGSANWTSVALASDEIVMRIYGPKIQNAYTSWIDYLYAHPPVVAGRTALLARSALASAKARGIDPYSKIQVN